MTREGEVHSKKANDVNMQSPFTMTSRNLHNIFIDRPDATHDDNAWMKNLTDHYHRPAAGGESSSWTSSSDSFTKENVSSTTSTTTTEEDEAMSNQTISFTLIFLALMIIYLTFCFHYRKLKFRRSYNDDNGTPLQNNRTRQRRQRDNQAVLDESSSAANRAAVDGSEEQRKLEERKRRIGEVLWTRLIVEEDEEMVEKGGNGMHYLTADDDGDEENQDNDTSLERNEFEDEEMGSKKAAMMMMEGRTLAQDENAAAADTLATSSGEATIATVPSSSEETTITSTPSNEAVPTIGTFPSLTVDSSSTPPSSPFRRYADALSCNNCHHHATNYCSNHNIVPCSIDAATSTNSPADKSSSSSSLTTITLSEIQQTYGDECNICLSTFQVGDRAAWSKHHFNGCIHVFHDECMKRWLLVRDGCPICRRLYLDEKGTIKQQQSSVVQTPLDDDGGGDVDAGGGESERDLESGVGANAIITIEEEED